ncbi:hypothetical protein J3F83DRAFT_751915 [Trichoderma novae-zelandiae]
MPRHGPEPSPTLRLRSCELHSISYGYKQIYKVHPEIPLLQSNTLGRKNALLNGTITTAQSGLALDQVPRRLQILIASHCRARLLYFSFPFPHSGFGILPFSSLSY